MYQRPKSKQICYGLHTVPIQPGQFLGLEIKLKYIYLKFKEPQFDYFYK